MTDDENDIRALIEHWAQAVHAGDMDGVLADHSSDIVMFDVPPPHDGVRGIEAYEATWPPFFDWQPQGAVFEIVALDVTAGHEVAFAHALLRCGTSEERPQSEQPSAAHHRAAQARRSMGRHPRAPLVPVALNVPPGATECRAPTATATSPPRQIGISLLWE